jgi:putative intracellular protease/amidase
MKYIKKVLLVFIAVLVVSCLVIFFSLRQTINQKTKIYNGPRNFAWENPALDPGKKIVFIIAGNDGTEMFDLMAPFYLFNATEKANVYVIAEKKAPVLLFNSLFILPHYSFREIDSLNINPDVIVIPNQTMNLKHLQKPVVVNWIRSKYTGRNIILSVCDGSATAAATGIYDGKPITTHATDFNELKNQYPGPNWVKDIKVTQAGNLYSTAGVSNAVEGRLMVIKNMFGENEMQKILGVIKYPNRTIDLSHKSNVVNTGAIARIATKVIFRKNYKVGVLLTDGINEFELASILDTYARTFPKSLNSFSINSAMVKSKYGLTLFPTGNFNSEDADELYVLNSHSIISPDLNNIGKARIINYDLESKYPIDICLDRIASLYGDKFKNCVKLTLDYN